MDIPVIESEELLNINAENKYVNTDMGKAIFGIDL